MTAILESKFLKEFVNDFLVSLGVALGGIVVGTWGEAQAAAGVISFIVARTAIVSLGKAALRWANT